MALQQNQFHVPNIQFRVLIIGRANAGKTSILQRVCDTTESPKIYKVDREGQRSEVILEPTTERGIHDIDDEMVFENHNGYIFHDSRGFEAGGEDEVRVVQEFVQRKSRENRLKDRLHAIWFCIPMDNRRPSLDVKYFDNICPDKNVPVIALFTKYDQFKRDIKMEWEDEPTHTETDIDAKVKSNFERHYLGNLSHSESTPYICLENMHRDGQRCTDLINLTANWLSDDVLALMLVAVQKDNLEMSINDAIKRTKDKFEEGLGSKTMVIKRCLAAFPWMWYFVEEGELLLFQRFLQKEQDEEEQRLIEVLRLQEEELREVQQFRWFQDQEEQEEDRKLQEKLQQQEEELQKLQDRRMKREQQEELQELLQFFRQFLQEEVGPEKRFKRELRELKKTLSKLRSFISIWRLSISNQNAHHSMIATIIILEYACRFRASYPDSTHAKALNEAYSQYKQSETHKVVKERFPGSPNQYPIPQFTEFILQHRLQMRLQ